MAYFKPKYIARHFVGNISVDIVINLLSIASHLSHEPCHGRILDKTYSTKQAGVRWEWGRTIVTLHPTGHTDRTKCL